MIYCEYGYDMNSKRPNVRFCNYKLIGTGNLTGWRFFFDCSPHIIEDEACDVLPVVLWEIPEDQEFAFLTWGKPKKSHEEHIVNVNVDGKDVVAHLFPKRIWHNRNLLPCEGKSFDIMLEAYEEHGFDVNFLYEANRLAEEHCWESPYDLFG